MPKFQYNKVVRDLIPQKMESEKDTKVTYTKLSPEKAIPVLLEKLHEEALEAKQETKKEKILQEVGDIQSVIDSLLELLWISKQEFFKIQKEKDNKKGSFKERLFIKHIEINENHEWYPYHKSQPQKYPEVKEE